MLTSVQRTLIEVNPINYPFGNTRSRNVLQDFNCEVGDFNPCSSPLKVLFLGSGDLRNALQVAKNESFNGMQIHLNDYNPLVVARNITILKIISAPDFNPKDDEDFAFLWDVWYNLEWPEVTRKRFQGVLKDLLNDLFPQNVSVPKTSQSEMLKKVWNAWLSISSKTESEASSLMKKVGFERKQYICEICYPMNPGEMENANIDNLFSAVIDVIASNLERSIGLEGLNDSERHNIHEEAKRFFEKGSCRLENDTKIVCLNPTMLDLATLRWSLHYSLCPFDGYLPLVKEELDISMKSKMMIRSCQKILKNLISFYRKRLIDGKIFELFFYLEDALEFCYSENVNKFDVIDCSNIADHVGLPNLILACIGKLSDHSSAMLFTETLNWLEFGMGSVKFYLEKVLCCPLSMIPTIYGLRLKSRIELGFPEYVDFRRPTSLPVYLCWQKALPFRNVVTSPSSALSGFLDQLANVCFDAKFPLRITGVPPGSEVGMLLYTPQTFSYVVNSMIQRLGGDHWLKKDVRPAEMHRNFQLARRTLDAWKDGQKILKLSAHIPTSSSNNFLRRASVSGIPILRLILLPKGKNGNCYDFFGPNVHFIDNFKVKLEKCPTGFQEVSISFLLIPNHGLEKTHRAILVDISDGSEVVVFESFGSVQVEDWNFPYPFIPTKNKLELTSPEEFHMKVDSCVESEDQFHLKINVTTPINVSGLKVTTNHRAPCESCHEVTVLLNQPENVKPLSLSFPYPILVDDIRSTLNLKSRHVDLVLKKALWEPWPCEYRPSDDLHNVLDPDQLKPWKEEKSSQTSSLNRNLNLLENHIRSQFNIKHLENTSLMEKSSLNFVRFVMKDLFMDPSRYVTIQRLNAPTPDWFFRVHRPVSTSPTGSPVLLLSAFDFRLAEKLISDGKWSQKKNVEDFKRVNPGNEKVTTIPILTTEDSQLLRFVLRLNRSKITPSSWQKKNLTLGEDSPWMATFVSPLYCDNPHLDVESFDAPNRSTPGRSVNDNNCCATCKKVSEGLKRCSRCRSTVYCSVECQRQHWAQHKMVCKKM